MSVVFEITWSEHAVSSSVDNLSEIRLVTFCGNDADDHLRGLIKSADIGALSSYVELKIQVWSDEARNLSFRPVEILSAQMRISSQQRRPPAVTSRGAKPANLTWKSSTERFSTG